MTEPLEPFQELVQAGAVLAKGLAIDRQLADLGRLAVDEAQVAAELGIHLAWVEKMNEVNVEPALEQRPQSGFISFRIEEVGEDDRDSRLAPAGRIVREPCIETGPAAGLHAGEERGQRHELIATAHRSPPFGYVLAQDSHPDALEVHQPDEPEGGGQAHCVLELGRSSKAHGRGAVHQEVQAQILLVHEQLDVQAIRAGVDIPVDVPQIVADAVGPVVGELDALTLARAPALALHMTAEDAAGGQGQALELRQEIGTEELLANGCGHAYRSSRAWK